jgi:hypothetical protein
MTSEMDDWVGTIWINVFNGFVRDDWNKAK